MGRKKERKRKDNAEALRTARSAEKNKEEGGRIRRFGALERKSPPFANGAKDGAPSSSLVKWRDEEKKGGLKPPLQGLGE
ncbi:MAG TPA: hypothetical protein VFI38_19875 [Candidatus Acidoferrum sp.]|nr:hypothetical protein [Candidatus Acidoferrum sp.]